MSTTAALPTQSQKWVRSITHGIIAGIIGGIVFGMMMAMMNMLPMVAMLVKSDSPIVGFVVHLVISAGIGASFGIILSFVPVKGRTGTIASGAVYGMIWWVLGALALMPLMLGMANMVFQIGDTQWASLIGHLIFGVITGFVFNLLDKRR